VASRPDLLDIGLAVTTPFAEQIQHFNRFQVSIRHVHLGLKNSIELFSHLSDVTGFGRLTGGQRCLSH
jgi:hypothetical protein